MAKTKSPVKTAKPVTANGRSEHNSKQISEQKVSAGVDTAGDKVNATIVDSRPSIILPIAQPERGHCPRRIESRLTRRQGAALKALFCALREDHAKCDMEGYGDRGKVIEKEYGHALRWLLDRVADSWEQDTNEKLLDVEGLVF